MIRFGIKPDPQNRKATRLLKLIARNAKRAADIVAHDAASQYKERVELGLAEQGSRMKSVRDGLRLKEYKSGGDDTYLVISEGMKVVPESEVDQDITAVWIEPRMAEEWLFLLKRESPWPYTMLPVKPTKVQATIIGRRIRQDEMERLRRDKKTRLENILSELEGYGIDTTIDTATVEVEVVIDTAWEAIRAEFGLDGFRRVPVWQPALKEVLRGKKRRVRVMEEALQRPSKGTPVDDAATAAEVASIQDFQKKTKV